MIISPGWRAIKILAYRDPTGTFSKLSDVAEGLIDLLLTPVHFGHNSSDSAPVAGDDEGFASLHFIE